MGDNNVYVQKIIRTKAVQWDTGNQYNLLILPLYLFLLGVPIPKCSACQQPWLLRMLSGSASGSYVKYVIEQEDLRVEIDRLKDELAQENKMECEELPVNGTWNQRGETCGESFQSVIPHNFKCSLEMHLKQTIFGKATEEGETLRHCLLDIEDLIKKRGHRWGLIVCSCSGNRKGDKMLFLIRWKWMRFFWHCF